MKTTAFSVAAAAALTGMATALPQASPPDNTVYHQSPSFRLKAVNAGPNADVFPSDQLYLHTYHIQAGLEYGGLFERSDNTPHFYLNGTDLGFASDAAQLQFTESDGGSTKTDFPFGAAVQQDGIKYVPVTINVGGAQASWGTFKGDDQVTEYVYYHVVAQGGRLVVCKGDTQGARPDSLIVKYGGAHIDPVIPAECSTLKLQVEYV